ncbi:MAG: response regulator transcription factor [Saprospiraceae bacterium]|nr:response regulator transcription factor [Saprospiraceae bacterium]
MKIIIYEDDEKLRQSLSLLIDGTGGYSVVGAFPNCKNVVEEVTALRPDIVLMDIDMPEVGGIEGVKLIKEKYPDTKILMHTVFDDNDKLFACLQAGADGYLLKKTSPAKLLEALQDIYTGGAPMSPGIARRVLATFHHLQPAAEQYGLTKREKEILQLLTEGYTYKAISAECHISMDTVSTHLRHIYEKLHVNCGTEAVAKAIRERLV